MRYEHWMPVDRDPWLIVRARQLRANQTSAETVLWQKLRAGRLAGYRFRRQHPIGPYIVDFACLAARLIVEVDSPTHENASIDKKRDRKLAERGFQTIRRLEQRRLREPRRCARDDRGQASATLPLTPSRRREGAKESHPS
jgi:very-short-patch-repair endonuclease